MTVRPGYAVAVVAFAAAAALSCADPGTAPGSDGPVERTVTFGPADLPHTDPGAAPILRAPLDLDGSAWITGIRVEAAPEVRVTDAGVTLDVEADVVRVSSDAMAFDLPAGYGVPIERARSGLPPDWRRVHATVRAIGRHGAIAGTTVDVVVRTAGDDGPPRIALWRIPIDVDPNAVVVRSPEGAASIKVPLASVLPVAGTIHAIVPRTSGRASEVRVTGAVGGAVSVRIRRAEDGTLGPWTGRGGIRVAAGSDARLEIDLFPDARVVDLAVDVYLRPDGDVALSYRGPEPDGDRPR